MRPCTRPWRDARRTPSPMIIGARTAVDLRRNIQGARVREVTFQQFMPVAATPPPRRFRWQVRCAPDSVRPIGTDVRGCPIEVCARGEFDASAALFPGDSAGPGGAQPDVTRKHSLRGPPWETSQRDHVRIRRAAWMAPVRRDTLPPRHPRPTAVADVARRRSHHRGRFEVGPDAAAAGGSANAGQGYARRLAAADC